MTLLIIQDFAPNYSEIFANKNFINYSFSSNIISEKIGTIKDL